MFQLIVLFLCLYGLAMGQSPCGTPPATSTFTPIAVRYTPFMTAQVGPTSTIWDQIVTTWFNALDCRYVNPIRVDENPAAEGPFTAFTRSPVLTVTRIGCMPETTAVTRRDTRGQHEFELRSIGVEQGHKVVKRRTAAEAVNEVISEMSDKFPPDVAGLTVQAYRYLVSVNTAIFAIHIVQAGVDLNQTCLHLRDPAFEATLFRTIINPVQAGDIVCFAASNGLYFEAGMDAVVTYLESLVYAIQVRPGYPASSDDFCWPVLTQDSPFLGIDTNGISQYLCPSGHIPALPTTITFTRSSITATRSQSTIAGPPTGGPYVNTSATATSALTSSAVFENGTITTVASTAGITGYPNATLTTLAPVPPYANSTFSTYSTEGNATYSSPQNTAGTAGSVTASGTGYSYTNATYTNATYTAAGTGTGLGTAWATGNLPPSPTVVSPEIESVASTPTRRYHRW